MNGDRALGAQRPWARIRFCCCWLGSAHLSGRFPAGVLMHSCNFDHGLCGWIREKDRDGHWQPVRDPAGNPVIPLSQGLVLPISSCDTALCLLNKEGKERLVQHSYSIS